MKDELQQFAKERSERIRLLQERQLRELEQFDEESARRGIRSILICLCSSLISIFNLTCGALYSALALTEPPREFYEEDPKCGSMLSLVHSNSSTSVGPNSL